MNRFCRVSIFFLPAMFLVFSALLPPVARASTVDELMAEANRQSPAAALATLLRAQALGPNRADLLAQISMAWSDSADLTSDHTKAEAAVRNALAAAEQAVKLDPRNSKAHLSLSIAAGRLTDFVDNSTKLQLSRRVRGEAERSVALNPKEDFGYYILGRWHLGMATLNPVLRFIAQKIYGTMLPASLDEASANLQKAVALAPEKIIYHQYLAQAYKALGWEGKAVEQWQAVLGLPAVDADGRQARREAQAALRRRG